MNNQCPCEKKLGPSVPKHIEEEQRRTLERIAKTIEKISYEKRVSLQLPDFIKNVEKNDE